MSQFDDSKIHDVRAHLFDAEVLLLRLTDREALTDILSSDCPEVILGALLEKTCALVSDATAMSTSIIEARDDDIKAAIQQTATEIVEHEASFQRPNPAECYNHLDKIDEIHEQSRSMLLMMLVYIEQARDGGEELSALELANYVGQLIGNMDRGIEASSALGKSLKGDDSQHSNHTH